MIRTLSIALASTLLIGCKLIVISTSGGWVRTESKTMNCESGSVCEFEIEAVPFVETFIALPHEDAGYEFVRWQGGDGFVCGDSTDPICTISLGEGAQNIVSSFAIAYLMPVFRDVGIDTDKDGIRNELDDDDDNDGVLDVDDPCPLNPDPDCPTGAAIEDVIVAAGREWAQPDLFFDLTWNEIDSVCPHGVCSDGAILNGYDMTGWRWARTEDFFHLMNWYIGAIVLGGEVAYYEGIGTWALDFFDRDGWRGVSPRDDHRTLYGWLGEWDPVDRDAGQGAIIVDWYEVADPDNVQATPGFSWPRDTSGPEIGSWFYRAP